MSMVSASRNMNQMLLALYLYVCASMVMPRAKSAKHILNKLYIKVSDLNNKR